MEYRKDIEGLRGVAILSVILFHAGVPFFGGGFTGVDVFFVISGFLIFSILFGGISEGSISFRDFVARRVRRLYPVFIIALAATAVASLYVLYPNDYASFIESLKATALQISNIYFYNNTGYFDGASEFKPLLHMWSIAIEWQFYIFLSIALFLLSRVGTRYIKAFIVLAFLVSLGAGFYSFFNQKMCFYLLPFRLWEFLLGALCVFIPKDRITSVHSRWMTISGLVLIVLPVVGFDFFKGAVFPGPGAVPSCLGAALIIAGHSDNGSPAGRVLTWKPIVLLGQVSYSLYLFHWPALVLFRYHNSGTLPVLPAMLVLAGATGLSFLLYKLVEQPVRRFGRKYYNGIIVASLALTALLYPLTIVLGNASVERQKALKVNYARFAEDDGYIRWSTPIGKGGQPGRRTDFLLLGDSHALSFQKIFDELAKADDLSGYSISLSDFLFGGTRVATYKSDRDKWKGEQEYIRTAVRKLRPKNVVLAARWAWYTNGYTYEPEAEDVYFAFDGGEEVRDPRKAFELTFNNTIDMLRQNGVENIWVILPVPEQKVNVPIAAQNMISQGEDPRGICLDAAEYDKRNEFVLSVIRSRKDLFLIDLPDALLRTTGRDCYPGLMGKTSLYTDTDHMSYSGTRAITEVFGQAMDEIKATARR